MVINYINSKWSMARRLVVISAIFFIPSAIQFGLHIRDIGAQISVMQNEVTGAALADRIWQGMGGGTGTVSSGEESAASQFGLADEVRAFFAATGETARVRQGAVLLDRVGDKSALTLDPFEDTYHAQDLFLQRLPRIKIALAQLKDRLDEGSGSASAVISAYGAVRSAADDLDTPFAKIYRLDASGSAKAAIEPINAALKSDIAAIGAAVDGADTSGGNASIKGALQQANTHVDAAARESVKVFDRLAGAHQAEEYRQLYWMMAFLLAASVAAFVFLMRFSRSFSSRLSDLVGVMDRVSRNDVSVVIPHTSDTNENGQIAEAIARFKDSAIASLKAKDEAEESAKQQQEMSAQYAREHETFMDAFTSAADRIARGDFSHRIVEKVIHEYEPIMAQMNLMMGRLETADAQKVAAQNEIQRVVDSLGEALAKLASGNLEASVEVDVAPEFESLKADFNQAISQLKSTIDLVKKGTVSIKLGTDEISQASDDLARRTETQAASLEETAAAVKEITQTVGKTAREADHARETVSVAKTDAEKSGEVVRRAIDAMRGIETSSKQISQIIGVIDEIAFQTNLLALNAGVEAARAGEAGRGFAVVASEVRALAQRSAEAAKEIKGLISASTGQVTPGVQLVGETGQALTRIVDQVAEINAIVTSIAASANEQAHGLDQVNTAVNEMDQVTQQNAAMVEEATAATQTLARQTEDLARLVSRFATGNDNVAEFGARRDAHKAQPRAARPKMKVAAAAGGRSQAAAKSSDEGWEEF